MASNVSARKIPISLTAENTFSNWVPLYGDGMLILSGTFVATGKLQISRDESTIYDVTDNSGLVKAFTAGGTYTFSIPSRGFKVRFGIATGSYTSGTVIGEISQ